MQASTITKRLALCALAAAATLMLPAQALAQDKIVIGMSAPITGDNAEYGEYFRSGALLAVKHINAADGIRGKQVELLIQDSKADPKEAVLIAQRFVSNRDVLAVIGDFNSSASMAAAQLYDPAGLVQISPTASHPDFTKVGKYIFRAGTTQQSEAPFIADWGMKTLGYKKIATIYIKNDWGNVTNKIFAEAVAARGGTVVAQESFIPGDKDFTASLTKIKSLEPDMLFIGTQWADAALVATQARKLGLTTALMATGSVSTDNLIKSAGDAVEGIRANAVFFVNDTRPVAARYVTEYRATYLKSPHDHSALTYDAVMVVAEAIRKAGPDRAKIRDALAATNGYEGVTGKFRFDENRNPVKDFVKVQVVGGKWQVATK